ncbi:MAG: ATP-binding protein [Planctomycetota bacterium]|nr:ATP-binding protein [Planctomycetota bacterium]MDA1213306.1 ATP-binding protein [Planctomycetota bacterium]
MFLTRSIRRKLTLGLGLVATMLGLMAIGAIGGLWSYRDVVNSLEFQLHHAPDRGELDRRICHLAEPLLADPVSLSSDARIRQLQLMRHSHDAIRRQTQLVQQLREARENLTEYRKRLDNLPPTPGARERVPLSMNLLTGIESGLVEMERLATQDVEPGSHDANLIALRREFAKVLETVRSLPEPQEGLNRKLDEAQNVYRSRIWLVIAASIGTVVLFFSLIWFGTRWIFIPIKKLHQGARRVAQGDFNHRVILKTNDEMATLAESFNQMTDRFQEIKEDLDRQVNERSKQLVRSERLAGIGFLAAGVAHEINNPLSAVTLAAGSLLGQVDHLAETKDPDEWEIARNYLEMIQRETVRCREITSRLLDFARGQNAVRSQQDLTKSVRDVLSMVGHLSKYRDRQVKFDYDKPLIAEVNPNEIKQVILNLTANALEAMEAGGTLTIDAQERPDTVMLSFTDTGCGMTPEVLENLFEPFYTTKIGTKGTGLGLSITHGLVANHGGRMEVTSSGPGQGSTFRVYLPRKASLKQVA